MVACSAHYLSYPFCRYIRLSHSVGQKCDPPQDLLSRFSRLTLYHHCFGTPFMESLYGTAQFSFKSNHRTTIIIYVPRRVFYLPCSRRPMHASYVPQGGSYIFIYFQRRILHIAPILEGAYSISSRRSLYLTLEGDNSLSRGIHLTFVFVILIPSSRCS